MSMDCVDRVDRDDRSVTAMSTCCLTQAVELDRQDAYDPTDPDEYYLHAVGPRTRNVSHYQHLYTSLNGVLMSVDYVASAGETVDLSRFRQQTGYTVHRTRPVGCVDPVDSEMGDIHVS